MLPRGEDFAIRFWNVHLLTTFRGRAQRKSLVAADSAHNKIDSAKDRTSLKQIQRVVALGVHNFAQLQLAIDCQLINRSDDDSLVDHLDEIANIHKQIHPRLANDLGQGDLDALDRPVVQNHRPVAVARRQLESDLLDATLSLHAQADIYREMIAALILQSSRLHLDLESNKAVGAIVLEFDSLFWLSRPAHSLSLRHSEYVTL